MLKITKLNKKEMLLEDIFKYTTENDVDKKNVKDTFYKDINDENGNHICREYKVTDKNDIVTTFIIQREIREDKDKFYLTHIYENPHATLDLDDEEELF